MKDYMFAVILFNTVVELLLLLSVNRIAGFPPDLLRCLIAAGLGGIYGGICLLPGFRIAGNFLCRSMVLVLMGLTAFGMRGSGFRRCMLFLLLSMALGGIVLGIGDGGILTVISGGVLFCFASWAGLRTAISGQEYVDVELHRGDKRERLLALRDTGNHLRDPVSGQRVLVVDDRCAKTLLGLTREQLCHPVETVAQGHIPGLRLIPYRTVGQSAGMLLAIRLEHVRIGSWRGSAVVAFSPGDLGENNGYRGLTGGMV